MEGIMHGMKEIILEAESLPVEERAIVIDSLLRTMNPPVAAIDREWVKVAQRRLAELRSGAVKSISGNEVFSNAGTLITGRKGFDRVDSCLSPGCAITRHDL